MKLGTKNYMQSRKLTWEMTMQSSLIAAASVLLQQHSQVSLILVRYNIVEIGRKHEQCLRMPDCGVCDSYVNICLSGCGNNALCALQWS